MKNNILNGMDEVSGMCLDDYVTKVLAVISMSCMLFFANLHLFIFSSFYQIHSLKRVSIGGFRLPADLG